MEKSVRNIDNRRSYFFDEGIRFECTQCGACCTGEEGYVFLNRNEIRDIAEFIGCSTELMCERYVRNAPGDRLSLVEKDNGDCCFFQEGRCAIYPIRPLQCRTYPFWPETMRSEKAWEQTCRDCPGIGKGPKVGKKRILEVLSVDYAP